MDEARMNRRGHTYILKSATSTPTVLLIVRSEEMGPRWTEHECLVLEHSVAFAWREGKTVRLSEAGFSDWIKRGAMTRLA